jgi:hypothetical protein
MALQLFKIATQTLSTATSTITFSSIPQGYTDLLVKVSLRSTGTNISWTLAFNSSSSGYSQKTLYGDGTNPGTQSLTSQTVIYGYAQDKSTYTANTFNNGEIYIPNYNSSNNKSVSIDEVSENNAIEAYGSLVAGLWANTAAITSITIGGYVGDLVQYSTATLYGIL